MRDETRSYFFNELDGLENNDGLLIVASTNYLSRLDPGLTKRPSRFDRKYEFSLPNEHERTLYCDYWREKLQSNDSIEFPKKLCPAMARVTPGFSFAFLQECFVATLLALVHQDGKASITDDDDDLDDFKLWVAFKEQADILRKDMDNQRTRSSQLLEWCRGGEAPTSPRTTLSSSTSEKSAPHHCHCQREQPDFAREETLGSSRGLMQRKQGLLPKLLGENLKYGYINPAAYNWEL